MNHRTEILPGVYLTAVQSDKFKTGCFSLNLLRPMKKEEAAANALIPSVLLRGSERCPDIASISAKLDELYGASIGTLIRKKGEVQLVGFYCDYVQDEYVDEPVFAPVMAFLAELLLNPRLENGAFPEAVVDSEKLNLENAMLSRINDKRTYAASQLIRTMCAGQPYGIPRIGEPEDLKNITAKSLYAHYWDLLARSCSTWEAYPRKPSQRSCKPRWQSFRARKSSFPSGPRPHPRQGPCRRRRSGWT